MIQEKETGYYLINLIYRLHNYAFGSTFTFLPIAQSQTKNEKELPSQHTKTVNMNKQTNNDRKRTTKA